MKVFLPSTALAPYVEAYYLSFDLGRGKFPSRFPAVSTSYIKLSSFDAIVSGQTPKPTVTEARRDDPAGLGVKLRAGAFHALFNIPARELTDQVIGLDEVLGRTATVLVGQLAEEASPVERVQRFERILMPFAQRAQHRENLIAQQAVAALQQLPAMPIAKLAEELGYSARQLQRNFNNIIGLSPRLYQRLCRFEKALELIHASAGAKKISWPSIAQACGYSDQAHFIREFHEFAGCTPGRYLTSTYVN